MLVLNLHAFIVIVESQQVVGVNQTNTLQVYDIIYMKLSSLGCKTCNGTSYQLRTYNYSSIPGQHP